MGLKEYSFRVVYKLVAAYVYTHTNVRYYIENKGGIKEKKCELKIKGYFNKGSWGQTQAMIIVWDAFGAPKTFLTRACFQK